MNDPLHVLSSTSWVLKSEIVQIDRSAISAYAKTISLADIPTDPGVTFSYPEWITEEKIGLLLIMNAVNFSFWPDRNKNRWIVHTPAGKTLDGSTAAFWCLETAAKEGLINPTDFTMLARLSGNKLAHIFRHQTGNEIPMLQERVACLNQLGAQWPLMDSWGIQRLINSWQKSAAKAVTSLTVNVPNFHDAEVLKNGGPEWAVVYFHKRAQLAVSMIHRVLVKENLRLAFRDIDVLTAFADYRLPQVLRGMGILKYHSELANLVDAQLELPAGSPGEISIRAATIWAAEYLRQDIEKHLLSPVTASHVDTFLWYKARELKDSLAPHHRTRTIAY